MSDERKQVFNLSPVTSNSSLLLSRPTDGKEFDERQPGDEAADVRRISHAAARFGAARQIAFE